ncbi:CHAP domain-containing protein [Streptomyces sp. ID05-26A]|nr:CHAP domain-containing protein [Streptomyces sp. ID05-26A]
MSIKTTAKRTATAVIAASFMALGLIPASADTRTDIRDLAAANISKKTCDTNSLGGQGFMGSCAARHAWCSDFARWVWGNRNLNVDRLTPSAGTFYTYGERHGTLHKDSGYVPQVGDAVVLNYQGNAWADHVSLVDAVYANGTIRTINGNFGGSGPTSSSVQYATGGGRVGQVIAGQTISAFVSPAGVSDVKPTTARLGVQFNNSSVHVKEGNLYAPWVEVHGGGIAKSETHGDMVGVLTTSGDLYVKQGNLWQGWLHMAGGVKDFALESEKGRVAVLRTDGTVAVKEGGLQGTWVEQAGNVKEVELSGTYIGVVTNDGKAFVKEDNLWASWTEQLGNAANLELNASNGRIAVVRTDGTLTVKEGGLYANWVEQTGGVKDVDLSGEYLGVVLDNGLATVKVGNLYSAWIDQLGNAANIEVDAKTARIGVLRNDGSLTVKDGGPYSSWVEQTSAVTDFSLTNY